MAIACKICIALKGLKGSEIKDLPQTDEELFEHVEREHHIAVRRPDETPEQAMARLIAKYPESADHKTCKHPDCIRERQANA